MPMRSIQLAFATHGTGVDVAATLPPGHTAFSWQGRALARPEGHTAFSWVDGAVAPAAGDDHAEARVAWAEVQAATVRTNMTELPAGVAKAKAALEHAHVTGSVLWRAPSTYYSWKLAERAKFLDAPVDSLCKSLVLVNSAMPADAPVTADPSTSRFVVVLLQYVSRLDTDQLAKSLRAHAPASHSGGFRLAVADEDASCAMTGYGHNAVTPFGSDTRLPVVVSEAIAGMAGSRPGAAVWLGGGHVDVKLRLPVDQLLRPGALTALTSRPLVLRCSVPREAGDDASA